MAYKKLSIILDADDVLLSCNQYALEMLGDERGIRHRIDEITAWGNLGTDVDLRLQYFRQGRFYLTQPPMPGAAGFLKDLMDKAEVFIMTAAYPEHMGERIGRLMELFPFFPADHIIMGQRKDLLHADVMLDDRVDNLASSGCALPVLFRQPWNHGATGICSVSGYGGFLTVVDFLNGKKSDLRLIPKVVCIVGPSGSGKQKLADELCGNAGFARVRSCTTDASARGHSAVLSRDAFDACLEGGSFLETTYYGGESFGTRKQDFDRILDEGKNAVAVMDISGCMSVYNAYPGRCMVFYADRDKKECLRSLLGKEDLTRNQVIDRILAFDMEQKNRVLADYTVRIEGDSFSQAAQFIISHLD